MKIFSVFYMHILLYENSKTVCCLVIIIWVFEYHLEITNAPNTNSKEQINQNDTNYSLQFWFDCIGVFDQIGGFDYSHENLNIKGQKLSQHRAHYVLVSFQKMENRIIIIIPCSNRGRILGHPARSGRPRSEHFSPCKFPPTQFIKSHTRGYLQKYI